MLTRHHSKSNEEADSDADSSLEKQRRNSSAERVSEGEGK